MKICRVQRSGQIFYAAAHDGCLRRLAGAPYKGIEYSGETYSSDDVVWLPPCEPSKIVAVGLNYARHAAELKETLTGSPVIFLKPPTALIGHEQAIVWPAAAARVDYEAELAVVIGRVCRNIPATDAAAYIFGYTALNDVTARDLQKIDGQWTRAKSFDTFCPLGPYIDTAYDPKGRRIQSVLNGDVRQDGVTSDMLYGAVELVAFISECMTLLPGDIIATGTPEGIGPMQRGDMIEIRIEGLETLRNSVE